MDLLDFLGCLWQKKWQILLGSAIPSLIFGLMLYLAPRSYLVRWHYSFQLDSLALEKLSTRFYSAENMHRLVTAMEEAGLKEMTRRFKETENEAGLRKIVQLEVKPDYIEFQKKQNLKLSFERTWADNVEKLEELTAEYLTLALKGAPEEEMEPLFRLVRHNFEKEMSLYQLKDTLKGYLYDVNRSLAQIERERVPMENYRLQTERTLARLKKIDNTRAEESGFDLNLTFTDLDKESRYLPLPLQIQSHESEVARIYENIATAERSHEQKDRVRNILLDLGAALERQLRETGKGLDGFEEVLRQKLESVETEGERNYLQALIKDIDNFALTRVPITNAARIVPMAKGTVKKTAYLFAALFLLGILLATLHDQLQRRIRD